MKTGSEAEMKRDLHDTVTSPRIWGMLYKKREEKAQGEKAEEEKAEEGEEQERQQEAPDGRESEGGESEEKRPTMRAHRAQKAAEEEAAQHKERQERPPKTKPPAKKEQAEDSEREGMSRAGSLISEARTESLNASGEAGEAAPSAGVLQAHALGSSVQPHFLLEEEGGVDVGKLELVKKEERAARHSFQQVGCLCEHNWVCPVCFVWNRAETLYDGHVCVWCAAQRPQNYHPPTWLLQGHLGLDLQCPVKVLVEQLHPSLKTLAEERVGEQMAKGQDNKTLIDGTAVKALAHPASHAHKALALPAPRTAYPSFTKHPAIVSQRGIEDGRRLQEEWQIQDSAMNFVDEGETETDAFEGENTDIVERTSGKEVQIVATDKFEWNPVLRYLNRDGKIAGPCVRV
jgi:hypothetical protein